MINGNTFNYDIAHKFLGYCPRKTISQISKRTKCNLQNTRLTHRNSSKKKYSKSFPGSFPFLCLVS